MTCALLRLSLTSGAARSSWPCSPRSRTSRATRRATSPSGCGRPATAPTPPRCSTMLQVFCCFACSSTLSSLGCRHRHRQVACRQVTKAVVVCRLFAARPICRRVWRTPRGEAFSTCSCLSCCCCCCCCCWSKWTMMRTRCATTC